MELSELITCDSGDPQLFHRRGLHDRAEQSAPGMMFPEPALLKAEDTPPR
jgi:hypothetical protein